MYKLAIKKSLDKKFKKLKKKDRKMLELIRQREDHGIARRANAMLLLDDGKSCELIAEFLYL
ncbi:MAG: hypothetical protein R6V04_03145, partial [bacterium]